MFFFLSKILTFLISPTVIILLLVICACIFKKPKIRRQFLLLTLALLLLFSNPFIINRLTRLWQVNDIGYSNTKHYDAAIVLSGFMALDEDLNRMTFGESVDRLTESLIMFRKGQIDRIIISGGSGSIVKDSRESQLAKSFLVNYSMVPDSAVIIDTASRNTYENAIESKKIIEKYQIKSALLITSASHMRRAIGCFNKVDVKTDTYSTDVTSGDQEYYPSDLFIPGTSAINQWETLMHEVAGFLIYKIQGYV